MDHRRYLSPVGMLKSFIHDKFYLIISTFNKTFKIFNVPTTQHYKKKLAQALIYLPREIQISKKN